MGKTTEMNIEVFAREIVDGWEADAGFFASWLEYRQALEYAEYWVNPMLEEAKNQDDDNPNDFAFISIQLGIEEGSHTELDNQGHPFYSGKEITTAHRIERILAMYVAAHREGKAFTKKEHAQIVAWVLENLPVLEAEHTRVTGLYATEEDIQNQVFDALNADRYKKSKTKEKVNAPVAPKPEPVVTGDGTEGDVSEQDESEGEDDEQEIIEVSQTEVKKAIKALMTGENEILALYYKKHEEYNQQYFDGLLSHPLITIERIGNRTLGDYNAGKDAMSIENHIRLNTHFVALNDEERVLETLRHEMIHQWQDEVLYRKDGEEPKMIKVPVTIRTEVEGKSEPQVTFTGEWKEIKQKRRVKVRIWHNAEFKDYAAVVGIPADGPKCTGNPAKMPQAKSYNRKFACECIASNGYPMTIWSTREVRAICIVCKKPYVELRKGGELVKVKKSHIEKKGENAIRSEKLTQFTTFVHYKTRDERDQALEELRSRDALTFEHDEGVYQKHHNAYEEGYRYWLAYTMEENESDAQAVATSSEAPKKRGRKSKSEKEAEAAQAKPSTGIAVATRHYENPEDLIHLYRELGALKAIAELFDISQATLTYQKKKHNIDFRKGTYVQDGETVQV